MDENGSLTYRLLGPVEVSRASGAHVELGGAQRRAVLAQLVLSAGRVVSVDALSEGLWGDRPPPTAVKAIHVQISRLRSHLPAGALATRPPGYVLDVDPAATDVGRFEVMLREARALAAAGRTERAADEFRRALDLWRGPALADVADQPFAAAAIARLEESRSQALEERLAADLDLGRHAMVVGEIDALARANPLRERLWALLMTALYRCGRQGEALDAFSRARRHLVDQLGIEPGPDLRRLEREVLDQTLPEPAGSTAEPRRPPRRAVPVSSTPGLRPPEMVVGRDGPLELLAHATSRLVAGEGAVVAVRGDEGLGKSALIATFAQAASPTARIVTGRGREQASLPYGPWAQVMHQLGSPLAVELIEGSGALASTPERHRLQVFEEVTSALRVAAFDQPLVVALDDLHWIDSASVDLLLHSFDEIDDVGVLWVLAWRAREINAGHPLSRLVHHLAKVGGQTIDLQPLDATDIERLVAHACPDGEATSWAATATSIHELTGGVPLFTTEMVALAARSDHDGAAPLLPALPETLRTLVARRLAGAGAVARTVADACSVVDEPMAPSLIEALTPDLDRSAVLEGLDRLVDAGLLVETGDGHAFAHGAFRRSIADAMRSGRRQMLHAAAYGALADQPVAPEVLVHLGDGAGPLVEKKEVLRQVRAAGDDAVRRGAFADAHTSFARLAREVEPGELAEALAADADAIGRSGDVDGMKATAIAALDAARQHGASDDVVLGAVTRLCSYGSTFGVDPEALRVAGSAAPLVVEPTAVAELASIRAVHHAMWGSSRSVTASALAEAEALVPATVPIELAGGLLVGEGLAALGSPDLGRRFGIVDQLLALDRGDRGRVELRGRALRLRCLAEMSAGRLGDLASTLDALERVASEVGSWIYRSDAMRWRITARIASGDRDGAWQAIGELEETSSNPLAGRALVGAQRAVLHLFTGEYEACSAYLDRLLSILPQADPMATDRRLAWLAFLIAQLRLGRHDEVVEAFGATDPDHDLEFSSCRRYTAELALYAELVAELGRADLARALLARLEPFRGQFIVMSWGEGLLGRAEGYIAALASLMAGTVDDEGFASAIADEEGAGDLMSARRTQARWEATRNALLERLR